MRCKATFSDDTEHGNRCYSGCACTQNPTPTS